MMIKSHGGVGLVALFSYPSPFYDGNKMFKKKSRYIGEYVNISFNNEDPLQCFIVTQFNDCGNTYFTVRLDDGSTMDYNVADITYIQIKNPPLNNKIVKING